MRLETPSTESEVDTPLSEGAKKKKTVPKKKVDSGDGKDKEAEAARKREEKEEKEAMKQQEKDEKARKKEQEKVDKEAAKSLAKKEKEANKVGRSKLEKGFVLMIATDQQKRYGPRDPPLSYSRPP
jgi:hypothetical protein